MKTILEHRQDIANNIQKAFENDIEIEKAKWQIGERRTDSRGIVHECYEYTADGKPRLRRVKKNKGVTAEDSKTTQSKTSTNNDRKKEEKKENTEKKSNEPEKKQRSKMLTDSEVKKLPENIKKLYSEVSSIYDEYDKRETELKKKYGVYGALSNDSGVAGYRNKVAQKIQSEMEIYRNRYKKKNAELKKLGYSFAFGSLYKINNI